MNLDSTTDILKVDKNGFFKTLSQFYGQLSEGQILAARVSYPAFDPKNIVAIGMGGSALGPDLIHAAFKLNVPFEVVKNYRLPGYVNSHTLVIIMSYSGNTEESISAFHEAHEMHAKVVVATSGGKLENMAKNHGDGVLKLPAGLQPRMSIGYTTAHLLGLLSHYKLLNEEVDLLSVGDFLKLESMQWEPEVPKSKNIAKKLAEKLVHKIPVFYAPAELKLAAKKMKIGFNENAKHIAFWNYFPELNHNEMTGWQFPEAYKPCIVLLKTELGLVRNNKRLLITKEILAKETTVLEIEAKGQNLLEQTLYLLLLGDYISGYVAMLHGVDPTTVDLVEDFKKRLW